MLPAPTLDRIMIWAAFTTAFFGFLHASEFCCTSKFSYILESTLLVEDVSLSETVIVLKIKSSKMDPYRDGKQVRLAPSGKSICPFKALRNHLASCKNRKSPVFIFTNKYFLTRQRLSSLLTKLLHSSDNEERLSSHSLRIGAATTAARTDTPDLLIKELGRWSSNCYQRYIRVSNDVVDAMPAKLAN